MEHQHQNYTCPMHPEVVKPVPGKCPKCGMDLVFVAKVVNMDHSKMDDSRMKMDEQPVRQQQGKQQYTCSMHPKVIKDEPGKCPYCGMVLIPLKKNHSDKGGHNKHVNMIDDFKKRFYVVLILTIPIMLLSPMIQYWLD